MRKSSWFLLIAVAFCWWAAAAVEALAAPSYDYLVSIDPASHRKFGLYYPATYKFRLPPGSSGLSARVRFGQGSWQALPEKRRGEFFNGINAARFDYAGGFAYVSAAFNQAYDSFYLRFVDRAGRPVAADFDSIPKFYDDRTAAVSLVLDDWNTAFYGCFDKAVQYLQADNLYFSVAVITTDVNFQTLQRHIDLVGDLMEIASHSRHHPGSADAYAVSGYDAETAGSRDDLIANLTFNHKPFVPLYVEPHGYSDPDLQSAVTAANYLVERCSNNYFYSGAEFVAWDPAMGRYGRAAETFDDAPSGDTPALLTEANAAFDKVLALGGIYTLVDHPEKGYWRDNSYLLQHLDYIKGKSDLWYVPLGQLYQYHFLQEMRGNLRVQSLRITVPDKIRPVVTSFTVPRFSRSLTVPITGLTATDNVGVTGYIITESAVKPSLADPGWHMTAAASGAVGPGSAASGIAAGTLPAPWTDQDIGSVGTAGSASYRNGVFTIVGGGSAAPAGEDAVRYIYRGLSGDGQIAARVVSIKGECAEGAAGVMIRQDSAAGSVTAAVTLGSSGAAFSRRATENGSTAATSRAGAAPPYWVRVARSGNTISSYISSDGANWELLESDQVTMTDQVLVGLAAGSGATSAVCTATFDNVQ